MTGPTILDDHTPAAIRAALEIASPEQAAILVENLRQAREYRTLHWRCKLADCDGMPHDGFLYRHARGQQNPPPGSWEWWYVRSGRGGGKTRTGGEFVKDGAEASILRYPGARWALVGRTYADARDVMVEGESGLLSVLPPSALKGGTIDSAWNRSIGELFLANGSRCDLYSSEKPAKLRGPQHHGAWGDEPAYWLDAHKGETDDTTWSNLQFGLRLGPDPRGILTSTPARVKLLVGTKAHPGILNQEQVIVTGWSTDANAENLAPQFLGRVKRRYAGTRLGKQEIEGLLLDDVEGALWTMALIDAGRIDSVDLGLLDRIVTAVDPNVTDADANGQTEADEAGIVVAGMARECPVCGPDERGGHLFVIADRTTPLGPSSWPGLAVAAHDEFGGDGIVAETNNGGDLVVGAIRAVDPRIPVSKVVASRGKRTRAEPVAQLYEQGRAHHVGSLPELEEEMTGWVPKAGDSPDRMDAAVWAATELLLDGSPGMRLRFDG